jgi:hypothetical protein
VLNAARRRDRPPLAEEGGKKPEATLLGVVAKLSGTVGPTVTRYELELVGVK